MQQSSSSAIIFFINSYIAHQRSLGRYLMTILVYCKPPVAMKMRTPAISEITTGRPRTRNTTLVTRPDKTDILGNAMIDASCSLAINGNDLFSF